MRDKLQGTKIKAPIVTTLEPFENWWDAEDYHQKYLVSNPGTLPLHKSTHWHIVERNQILSPVYFSYPLIKMNNLFHLLSRRQITTTNYHTHPPTRYLPACTRAQQDYCLFLHRVICSLRIDLWFSSWRAHSWTFKHFSSVINHTGQKLLIGLLLFSLFLYLVMKVGILLQDPIWLSCFTHQLRFFDNMTGWDWIHRSCLRLKSMNFRPTRLEGLLERATCLQVSIPCAAYPIIVRSKYTCDSLSTHCSDCIPTLHLTAFFMNTGGYCNHRERW